jgi:hypothetical protein
MRPIDARIEYPWSASGEYGGAVGANSMELQSILDAKCVQCHNATTNGSGPQEFYTVTMTDEATGAAEPYPIPRLDLSSTPITVTYDMQTATYPRSYVSIFYPAALEMEMGMGAEVEGTVPPKWGVPSDARNCALIEKINIARAFDASRTAWPLGQAFSDPNIRGGVRTSHPEVVGVTLTREERTALIRAFDMGGQYYSRQNTGFVPYAGGDPTSAGGVRY